jgi:WD40 repeat protein
MPDNNNLLSADKGGNIYKWDIKSEKQIGQGKLEYPSSFEIVTFTDWANIIMSGHENGTVCIWDISNLSKPILVKELIKSHHAPLRVIACNGLKGLIATAAKDSTVSVWKYSSSGTDLVKKIKTNSSIQDLVILPEGKELAIALESRDLITIDISTEKINLIFKSENSTPWSLKLNEGKSILAAGYSDGKIKLFDTEKISGSESLIFTFSEDNTTVEKMAFNNSNSMLAVAFADKSLRIFNLAHKAQKPVGTRDTKTKSRFLMFDPENKLFVCGADHFIRKIEPSTEKIASSFCELLKRNLTSFEWNQNIGETIPYEKTCKNK